MEYDKQQWTESQMSHKIHVKLSEETSIAFNEGRIFTTFFLNLGVANNRKPSLL